MLKSSQNLDASIPFPLDFFKGSIYRWVELKFMPYNHLDMDY